MENTFWATPFRSHSAPSPNASLASRSPSTTSPGSRAALSFGLLFGRGTSSVITLSGSGASISNPVRVGSGSAATPCDDGGDGSAGGFRLSSPSHRSVPPKIGWVRRPRGLSRPFRWCRRVGVAPVRRARWHRRRGWLHLRRGRHVIVADRCRWSVASLAKLRGVLLGARSWPPTLRGRGSTYPWIPAGRRARIDEGDA